MEFLWEGVMAITPQQVVMYLIGGLLIWLAVKKEYEPALLLPMGFGAIMVNLPLSGVINQVTEGIGETQGIIQWLFETTISASEALPILLFIGIGAMIDFGPLLSQPIMFLFGAAAQFGIFFAICAASLMGFELRDAASIGIIGAADGPTSILVSQIMHSNYVGAIAVAAYSYMALVPVIQPPIMRALTTEKERKIVMEQLKPATKTQKIIFPIVVTILVALLLPSAAPLVGCLMLGNLAKECGVTERLNKTMQNELMNIVTIFLGVTVGATATASTFLTVRTLEIIAMGIVAFGMGTAGGVLLAKLMNKLSGGKINPLIGSAGVSAVPMAARVSQKEGQKANPANFLLMHAMGPNVAGVIGSAIAAGVLLSMFG